MITPSRDNADNCYGNEYPSRGCLLAHPTVEDGRPQKTRAEERPEKTRAEERSEKTRSEVI
jgi:hypothetical protein